MFAAVFVSVLGLVRSMSFVNEENVMNIRALFSATLLASSLALLPQAHADGMFSSITSASNKLQSQFDNLSKIEQNHEKRLSDLQAKYENASGKQRAKLQKRIDSAKAKVEAEKAKLNAKKEKLTQLKDKLQNAPDQARKQATDQVNKVKDQAQNQINGVKNQAQGQVDQVQQKARNAGANAVGNALKGAF